MYTKKDRISESFERLIQTFHRIFLEQSYDSISIELIAKEAGMTRVNFYHYFEDKEDLLFRTYITLYRDMESRTPMVDIKTALADGKPLIYYALENIKENRKFYKQLFQDSIPSSVTYRILDFITTESFRTHEALRSIYTHPEIPYIKVNEYLSGAFWSLTKNLVKDETWDSDLVANFFRNLSLFGLSNFLQKPNQE